jgi:hypothetical protein
MVFFTSRFLTPAGGEYFFEHNGDSFRTRSYNDAIVKTKAIMAKHGITGIAESVLAEYMCPHMPDGFCTKGYGNKVFTLDKLKQTAESYFKLPLATFDVVDKRIETCLNCPKHSRTFCLTCVGALDWIRSGFRNARRILPVDAYTGTCKCAGTFAAVVASVDKDHLPEWTEAQTPETCWRNQ